MIEKALRYIVGLKEPVIKEIGGQVYSDKKLERISFNPKALAIEMSTLTSLVDYIKGNIDTMADKMIVHVISPTKVALYSQLDKDRCREDMVVVKALVPTFPFGKFIDHESFCIGLQSKFIDDPETERALVLKFAGAVEDGTVTDYGDDGITQKATVRTGITSKADAKVPNPVKLRPYRTFQEVTQPASEFIFRMKSDKYEGIQCAIFEADGGGWEKRAMKYIKEYLEEQLKGLGRFTVIS
ncbi:MAG: hypothetical protein ACI4F1_03730 [Bariatricus sp.]